MLLNISVRGRLLAATKRKTLRRTQCHQPTLNEGFSFPNIFCPVSKIDVDDENGKLKTILLDKQGRTEVEFNTYISDLEKKYSYSDCDQ